MESKSLSKKFLKLEYNWNKIANIQCRLIVPTNCMYNDNFDLFLS